MSRHMLIAGLLFVQITLPSSIGAQSVQGPELFLDSGFFTNPQANFTRPLGLASTSTDGLAVFDSSTFATFLRFYTRGRRFVGGTQLGGFTDIEGGDLERHPTKPFLYLLRQGGDLLEIDEGSGAVRFLFNLFQLPIDIDHVWDVQTSRVRPGAAGLIVPTNMTFGDFAIRSQGARLDFFFTGVSVAHPFVMRVRFVDGQFRHAQVLLMSSGTTAGNVNLPRGIAVSRQGAVLTSLPVLSRVTFIDNLVVFRDSFRPQAFINPDDIRRAVQNCRGLPCAVPVLRFRRTNMPTRSIDVDRAGNFYLASTVAGSADCLVGASGALVVVIRTFRSFRCHPVNTNLLNHATDIAVDATSRRIYMGLDGGFGGTILFFRIRS